MHYGLFFYVNLSEIIGIKLYYPFWYLQRKEITYLKFNFRYVDGAREEKKCSISHPIHVKTFLIVRMTTEDEYPWKNFKARKEFKIYSILYT